MNQPTITQHLEAEMLAQKVAEFIRYNKIDLSQYTVDEVVKAYHVAQMKAIERATREVYEQLLIDGF